MPEKSQKRYYVYILRCADGTFYTGITTDYIRRLKEHKSGSNTHSGYTRSHGAAGFDGVWATFGRSAASRAEYIIKALTRPQKEQLLRLPETLNELAEDASLEFIGAYYG